MSFSSPRARRGTSIIAALVFAAILGSIALSLNALRPNNPSSISAAAAASTDAASGSSVGYTGSCQAVITAAASQGHESQFSPVTDSKDNLKDSCNAAIYKYAADLDPVQQANPTNWMRDPNAYQCVGKSGTLKDNGNGTFTETMFPAPSVVAGKCDTSVCDTSGKCASAQLASGFGQGSSGGSGMPPMPSGSGDAPTVTPDQKGSNWCGDGASNPPACDKCPTGTSMQSGICQLDGAATNPYLNGTYAPSSNPTNIPDALTPANPSGALSNPYLNGTNKPDSSAANNPNALTPAFSSSQNLSSTCPPGTTGSSPNCTSVTNVGGYAPGNQGGGGGLSNLGGLGRLLSTFGNPNPSTIGGNSTGANNCSFIASIFGCKSVSCQISASPNPVMQGQSANLNWWTTGNVGYAQISGIGPVGPSGSYTIYPTVSTNYTLTVQDQNGNQNSCSVPITVTPRSGCAGTNSCVSPQTPFGVGTNGQACPQPPAQPDPAQCTIGSWQPTYATGNGCVTGYQCGSSSAGAPTAQISCSPQTAEAGQSIAIAFSCANATMATSSGFDTAGQLSGSATAIIARPQGSNANTATFTLRCSNAQSQATQAQCSVQFNTPSIVLIANPAQVPSGQTSTVGWVTSGMKSCVVSSPNDAGFTAINANNLSVNGTATTNPITQTTEFDLACTTVGGQTKTASTTVKIGASSLQQDIQLSSTADAKVVNHGDTVTINWQTPNAPAGAALSLWLIDLRTEGAIALITGGQNTSGSYQWKIPPIGASCDTNSPIACASDLVAGSSYGIEAALYKPSNAFLGGNPVPSGAVNPTYVDSGYTPNPFTVGQ